MYPLAGAARCSRTLLRTPSRSGTREGRWASDRMIFDLAMTAVAVHTLIGIPLSLCWRKGGTLVLPAAAHALIDAYRNTVL